MIEAIIRYSLQHRVLVLIAALILTGSGFWAVKHTPVDAIPDLSDVQVIVKTAYPGQAPSVVEDQVTYPLTTAMLAVPGAKTVRGFSFFGDSYVYVLFEDGVDMYWARSRVLESLSRVSAQLPTNAQPELGPDATGVGWVYAYALSDTSGKLNLSDLRALQDWQLKFALQTVPGVAEVATVGGMVKQYQIVVDPNKLAALNLPLSLIEQAVARSNQEIGASVVEMAEAEYMVTVTGYIKQLDALRSIPLGATLNGVPITLSDVASVQLGPQSRRGIAELNGEGETVGGIIVMRYGANAQQTIDGVKSALDNLKASLPDGVTITTVYDRSALIDRAVDTLWQKLLEELIIVALVCALFLLHLRSALVALVTLPLGILSAFILMHWQGINANIMSLGGIAIAIGAMTDGAIVMIENLHKHMANAKEDESSEQHWQRVATAATEVGPALFFSLLIITVSFLPVFMLEAQEGKMFSPLAYTKTYAMAASAGLAITLIPVLLGYFVRGKIRPSENNPLNYGLQAGYRPVLKAVLNAPKTTLSILLILTVIGFYPITQLQSEFMPELDEGDLMYMPTTYAGISIDEARRVLQKTDQLIRTIPEVSTVFGKVGRADTATDPAPLTMIETFIQLKPKSQWREGMTSAKLQAELDQTIRFPGVTNAWVMPIRTRLDMLTTGIKTPLGIKVSGEDFSTIQNIGQQIESVLSELNATQSVYAERVAGARYINIDINRDKAARFGMTIADIQQVIATAIGGKVLTTTVEGRERYPVNMRYPQSYRNSPESMGLLPIVTPLGQRIALADVANISIEQGPPAIKSENARVTGYVFIDVDDVDITDYVRMAQQAIDQHVTIPTGYQLTWAGQFESMARAEEKLSYVIPITLAVIIALLYLSFRRASDVALILITLPLAMVGGLWLLYSLDYKLSVAVMVGFIALAGVAVEIGVIMLVYLNSAVAELKQQWLAEQDEPSRDQRAYNQALKSAIIEGASQRVRPIVMTVSTVMIGLMPVLFSHSDGAEVMSRIAAPMVGGMASALLLSLILLPLAYYFSARQYHISLPLTSSGKIE